MFSIVKLNVNQYKKSDKTHKKLIFYILDFSWFINNDQNRPAKIQT